LHQQQVEGVRRVEASVDNSIATWSSALILLLLLLGCADRQVPTAPLADLVQDQSGVFYYHQGDRIYLNPDPATLVVKGTDALSVGGLSDLGLTLADGGPLAAGHRLLRVSGADQPKLDILVVRLKNDSRVSFVSPGYRTRTGNISVLPLDQIDVKFREQVSPADIAALANGLRLRTIRPPRPDSGFFAWRFAYADGTTGPEAFALAATLDRHPLVEWASPDKISDFRPALTPSDPYYSLQWHLKNAISMGGVPVDINAEQAWDITTGAKSTKVVVIDDGMDRSHQDLILAMGGGMGYDLMSQYVPPGSGENAYHPYCQDLHGTAIGGLIGGEMNGSGTVGIAPGVTLTIARIFRRTYPCNGIQEWTQVASANQIADAINWAWRWAGAAVISNSWGGGSPSNAITTAISNAVTQGRGGKGTVVVFAAGNTANRDLGNTGYVQYPATLSTVIAVGAIDRYGAAANYTPDGSAIAIVAPSGRYTGTCIGDIVTTNRWLGSFCNDGPNGDTKYTSSFSGTSAATPQVAAVAALLLTTQPNLTASQARARLTSRADPWGPAQTFGAGKVNAWRALYTPPPLNITLSGPSSVRPLWTCLWKATPTNGVAPYYYSWYVNGLPVDNGSPDPSELVYRNSGSAFSVHVTVGDSQGGASGSAQLNVSVSEGAPTCQY
jgi:subtilisin family serine protease